MENPISICENCARPVEKKESVRSETGRICFECCAELDKEIMDQDGQIDLILSHKNKSLFVQNPPGTLIYPVSRIKLGKRSKIHMDVWFFDHLNIEWLGVSNGISKVIPCTRLRERLN